MISGRNTRNIEKSLYKLRNDYGINNIGWYHTLSSTTDYTTGVLSPTRTKYTIKRAVSLPMTDMRKFSYALSFLGAAGPQFSYGGYFDLVDRVLIIRNKDLPKDFVRDNDDFIIINHKRYDIQRVQEFETERCLLVHIRELEGATEIDEFHETSSFQYLKFEDDVSGVI